MKVLFYGSGAFAIPTFEALHAGGHEILALVTQPDRGSGRGRTLSPPPVKAAALARGIPVLQPERVKTDPEALRRLGPEIQVVVAYGQILPKSVLAIPPRGTVNLHGSLLPLYRGAAPVAWAVLKGEKETGVSTMLLDEGLDTGPILLQESTPIGDEETAGALLSRLATIGAPLVGRTLLGLEAGSLVPRPQDATRASLAPILRKEDGRLDWNEPAEALARRVRAFSPWPGTHASLEGRLLKILRAAPSGMASAPPGSVLGVLGDALRIASGEGTALALLEVRPESRKAMSGAAFAQGARLSPGARLG
jgi:methionyl-tRNA formyltransferase